ncbi:MAG: serine hydrolase [Proteobacteria bacterium]|nr:serine hydrolase [Pseudomonadota bacterium]
MNIQGFCQPKFEELAKEFARNFTERQEIGASVCLSYRGETVVDLWGGLANPQTDRPWERDTISVVWSCTKGAAALCVHILVARGLIDFTAPIAHYWPEFGANGKEGITVETLLSHQAGLPALSEPISPLGFCDWEGMVKLLAAEKPMWEPGTRHGYHALTFGHLVGEIVRRVSGRTLGTFFKEEVAEPLGLDFWIGLPEDHEHRVAHNIPAAPPKPEQGLSSFMLLAMTDPTSIPYKIFRHSGQIMLPGAIDQRAFHAAEIPAANGLTNARGLAGMYRPLSLDGSFAGVRLVSEEGLLSMSAVRSAAIDAALNVPTRFSLGFVKAGDNRKQKLGMQDSFLVSEDAFGHTGSGGSVGFADPRAHLSFGYTMNQQKSGLSLDARGQSLIDAAYRCIGYKQSSQNGLWFAPQI